MKAPLATETIAWRLALQRTADLLSDLRAQLVACPGPHNVAALDVRLAELRALLPPPRGPWR